MRVAVLGAGAAGLVASRHLLGRGMHPTIFEASRVIGGAWSSSPTSNMWDHMQTNLSKFNCRFHGHEHEHRSMFPTKQEMQQYLESYAKKYVKEDCFRFGCRVIRVERLDDGQYRVQWKSKEQEEQDVFDGVVVATGFFAQPILPTQGAMHSSEYRSPHNFVGQSVAVVGASFSALEIAGDLAPHAKRVVSILPKIPYILPRYLPIEDTEDNKVKYLPVDFILYRRPNNDDDDKDDEEEEMILDTETNRVIHGKLRALVGKRQGESPLGFATNTDEPFVVAISDDYLSSVIDGSIELLREQRLVSITKQDDGQLLLSVQSNHGVLSTLLVDQVVCATGYRSDLSFLDQRTILDVLGYEQENPFEPLELCYETFHPDLPRLGFVGMYRGPHMAVMELQATLLAQRFTGTPPSFVQAGLEYSRRLRRLDPAERGQFPRLYVGFCKTLAKQVQDYQDILSVYNRNDVMDDSPVVSRVVLQGLVGTWSFDRTIRHFTDKGAVCRVDHITGRIRYSRRAHGGLLYREDGLFHNMIPGRDVEVFREYHYTNNEKDDSLEIYFVENGQRAHLFLGLRFAQETTSSEVVHWRATSDHLCVRDLYQGTLDIMMEDGLLAHQLTMTYRVKGPQKDYESITRCTRQS